MRQGMGTILSQLYLIQPNLMIKFSRLLTASLVFFIISGCEIGYYSHLAQGQWQMVSQRQPIQAVILDQKTPPELSADIIDRGIILCGGGAMIKNLDLLLSEACSLPVFVADNPLHTVVDGVGKVLENFEEYQRILL